MDSLIGPGRLSNFDFSLVQVPPKSIITGFLLQREYDINEQYYPRQQLRETQNFFTPFGKSKTSKNFYPGRLFGPGRLLIFDLVSTLDGYSALDVYSAFQSSYNFFFLRQALSTPMKKICHTKDNCYSCTFTMMFIHFLCFE